MGKRNILETLKDQKNKIRFLFILQKIFLKYSQVRKKLDLGTAKKHHIAYLVLHEIIFLIKSQYSYYSCLKNSQKRLL